ncbi:MAG: PAQR family membrane homeostasis protein TrhA [Methanomassiliicoccales archaeon]
MRDPVSGLTHLAGVLLSIMGMLALLSVSDSNRQIIAVAIYGSSMVLLYLASSLYHLLPVAPTIVQRLRLFDHLMIYVLIAGTYTPICLLALSGRWGISILISIWTLAAIGMATQGLWFKAPRWLSTLIYLLMGWLAVVVIFPLYKVNALSAIIWLMAGGLFYTVGAIIYALKKPEFHNRWFGFHEVFHLFVLAGSFCHYWMIAKYILPG